MYKFGHISSYYFIYQPMKSSLLGVNRIVKTLNICLYPSSDKNSLLHLTWGHGPQSVNIECSSLVAHD